MEADEWELMQSVTDSHSRANANRNVEEALKGHEEVVNLARKHGVKVRGGMATALGCPFEGRVPFERVLYVAETYYAMGIRTISVADTIGVADPRLVYETMTKLIERFPDVSFNLHLHNTRGMALANVMAGLEAGVRSFDAAIGGLGGCPYAPGATGNVSTEDVIHMLDLMGIKTGIDLDALLITTSQIERIVEHPLESAVYRAGKSSDLHPAPEGQVKKMK
jgi:hydroxymethylglutaryl-CoA lyase